MREETRKDPLDLLHQKIRAIKLNFQREIN